MGFNIQTTDFKNLHENTETNGVDTDLKKIVNEVKELSDGNASNDKIDINGLMENNFENELQKYINSEQAKIIINELDALIRKYYYQSDVTNQINKLRKSLIPIAYPISGNETMPETENDSQKILDLKSFKKDIKVINSAIDDCISMLNNNSKYANLKANLVFIKNTLGNPAVKDFSKITKFLNENGITTEFNGEDCTGIINGIKTFLDKLKSEISKYNTENSNYQERINQENQTLSQQKVSFIKFNDYIPNKINHLSELTKTEKEDIKNFIDNPNNKDTVLETYLKIFNTPIPSTATKRDRDNYNEIKLYIEKRYNTDTRGEWYLDKYEFTDDYFESYSKKNPDWDGSKEPDNSKIITMCQGKMYSSGQFKEKFVKKNRERLENNKIIIQDIIDATLFVIDNNLDVTNFRYKNKSYNYADYDQVIEELLNECKFVANEKKVAINTIKEKHNQKINELKENGKEKQAQEREEEKKAVDITANFNMSDENLTLMNNELSDKAFITKNTDNKITYNLPKLKDYLNSLLVKVENMDTKNARIYLKKMSEGKQLARISAVQILLNRTVGDCNLEINGILDNNTKGFVNKFQMIYTLNHVSKGISISTDDLPGKETITKLLEYSEKETQETDNDTPTPPNDIADMVAPSDIQDQMA